MMITTTTTTTTTNVRGTPVSTMRCVRSPRPIVHGRSGVTEGWRDARARASDTTGGASVQGGTTKTRCDRCLGTGLVLCPTCNDTSKTGWTIDGNVQRCDKKGYVPVMQGGVFGFGGKKVGEAKCERCNGGGARGDEKGRRATPGSITCGRCQGNKFLYFRSADWR